MKQKEVKLEIGKLLAIVITVVVIALLAALIVQSGFFTGDIRRIEKIEEPQLETKQEKPIEEIKEEEEPVEVQKQPIEEPSVEEEPDGDGGTFTESEDLFMESDLQEAEEEFIETEPSQEAKEETVEE